MVGNSSYCNGCRCLACREEHRLHRARSKAWNVARGKADPDLIPHNTKGGYCNWDCRCPGCTAANIRSCQDYRAGIRKRDPLDR
jgi:hypothetical protein